MCGKHIENVTQQCTGHSPLLNLVLRAVILLMWCLLLLPPATTAAAAAYELSLLVMSVSDGLNGLLQVDTFSQTLRLSE